MLRFRQFITSLVIIFSALHIIPYTLDRVCAQDKIVAIVNSEVITSKDLEDFLNFMRMQLSAEYKGKDLEEKVASMKLDLIDRLTEDRLLLQEAKKNKINVDENRVKAKISEIRKRYPSEAEFQKDLSRQGLVVSDIELRVREQLLTYYLVEEKVRNKIVVRPDEVSSFYAENKKEMVSPQLRELDATALENEENAKAVSYGLRAGQKLEELAARYPMSVNKLNVSGGEELRKDINEIVSNLSIGEVSAPVKIEDKYYVFRLNNITPARELSLSEAQDRIYSFLFEKKMQEGLTNLLDGLKKQSYIKIFQD